ncbi:hypothetical protein OIU74_002301 [Salix koriyanagi]|uniref:Transmembrane protein n=1 Tax=Salix koriyanagi TaxID=2511006 RepID=A0A9Q0X6X5_9ROSI|nr:hypothetical protein OIU74_002301 [Salix koriyanagi]
MMQLGCVELRCRGVVVVVVVACALAVLGMWGKVARVPFNPPGASYCGKGQAVQFRKGALELSSSLSSSLQHHHGKGRKPCAAVPQLYIPSTFSSVRHIVLVLNERILLSFGR